MRVLRRWRARRELRRWRKANPGVELVQMFPPIIISGTSRPPVTDVYNEVWSAMVREAEKQIWNERP